MYETLKILRLVFFWTIVGMVSSAVAQGESEALLITYPDYEIDTFYGNTDGVGHAGVLLINSTGYTRYYEFGRYDPEQKGIVRNQRISDAQIGTDGRATIASFQKILGELSAMSGKSGRIRASYFINMDFDNMNAQANTTQPTYDIVSFNCGHFAESVVLKGHPQIDEPIILNPTPNNLVDEYIEEGNAEVVFAPDTAEITVGEGDEADAKE